MLIGAEAAHGGLAGLECRLWGVSAFVLSLMEVRAKEPPLTAEGATAPRRVTTHKEDGEH